MIQEFKIATTDDLKEGEMKQISAGDTEILLANVKGEYHALTAHCTHYGAPLADGALCGDRLICPWHHACFDIKTGDLLDPPALDALHHFELRIDGKNIILLLPENVSDRRIPSMVKPQSDVDSRKFVILGGGAAGYAAAQTLREDGFKGRIIMITQENRVPYDRPNLSKDYLQGNAQPEWMPLRTDSFFEENGIEVQMGKVVEKVDHENKTIHFDNDESIGYDSLLVASGGKPRKLQLPNADLKNIFVLRSFAQADQIINAAENAKRAVVIGASFIGMETAASLTQRGLSVTVIAPDKVPFEKVLGSEIGEFFRHLHEKNGVKFLLGASVSSFEGNGKVSSVLLENGDRIETDLVIVGIGVSPVTAFLDGIKKEKDGGIVVDEHLCITKDLYAAGDIAHTPSAQTGELVRIEHWRYALQQGRIAAHNMAGKKTRFDSVPFFWTQQFGVSLRYVGHAKGWDKIIYDGNVSEGKFIAYYVKDGKIKAAAGIKRDYEMDLVNELMRLNKLPEVEKLTSEGVEATFQSFEKV